MTRGSLANGRTVEGASERLPASARGATLKLPIIQKCNWVELPFAQTGKNMVVVVIVMMDFTKNPPTPCLWQAPTSAHKTKKESQAGHSPERGGGGGSETPQETKRFFRNNSPP